MCKFVEIFLGSLLNLATFMGYFKQNLTIFKEIYQNFLGVLEILGNCLGSLVGPGIFWGLGSDAGASPMYMQKLKVPPLG